MYLLTQEVLPHETELPQTWGRSLCSWVTYLKDWIMSFRRNIRVSAAVETSTNGPFDDEVYICQYTAQVQVISH